jgi:diguanylate cyclase (GGDEF)-like protein
VYSVYLCLATQHDWRFVLLAVCICAVASVTSFHIYSHVVDDTGQSDDKLRRLGWLILTGTSAGAGIWATHFVAMLAYEPGVSTSYTVVATIWSLIIAVVMTSVGFWVAARPGDRYAIIGGSIIGAGVAAMHFVGMQALVVPGKLQWNLGLCAVAVLGGVALGAAAMEAFRRLPMRRAVWVASALLTLATCFMHFTAMGAVTVEYDPSIVVVPSNVDHITMALVVAGGTMLIMLSAFGAAFINGMAQKQVRDELRRQRDDLQQGKEELRRQNLLFDTALSNMPNGLCMFDAEQKLVVCNRRYAEMYGIPQELTRPGTDLADILKQRFESGVQTPLDEEDFVRERLGRQHDAIRVDVLRDGRIIQAARRAMASGWVVSTHEDITERERLAAQLKKQNELLQQRESELKSRNADLDAALTTTKHGIAMFDADERLVVTNQRYAEVYASKSHPVRPGMTLREIIKGGVAEGLYGGQTVDEVLRATRQLVARRTSIEVISRPRPDLILAVSFNPRSEGGWVVSVSDVTEREQLNSQLQRQHELLSAQQEQVRTQNLQLDAAINNMSQGLAMVDADLRLIVCNRRYSEMYGLTPEQVRPGTSAREIFQARLDNNQYSVADAESFVNGWLEYRGEFDSRVQELADGRLISVTRSKMPDGGLVVTHEDITEREKLAARLEEQHALLKTQEEQLRTQNLRLDTALNNMVQGLIMYDADQRVLIYNSRYVELYGLRPDQVRPGKLLSEVVLHHVENGKISLETAQAILASIASTGMSEGPVRYVNNLKDGRRIAVEAQPMPGGGTVATHQDITEQLRAEAKIVHMAKHDTLTGLPNRALLNERLEQALALARRGDLIACHLLDLDYFKTVNDTLGHPVGDKLLCQVAERLRALVRESDTIARMGGDEFAILQTTLSRPGDATNLARRIIDELSRPYDIDGQQVVIGTSVGIAIGPDNGLDSAELMRNADLALYRAKSDGRNTYVFFEAEMDQQMQARRVLETDLRKALTAGEFELHYQPIVNLRSNQIAGLEALIRWRHPDRGMVLPAMFIPLAEEIGFIIPLGEWVLREACATAAKWTEPLTVAVNLSPAQFRNPHLIDTVADALAASGLPPERLELEITEMVLLGDSEATLSTLFQLRDLGVRIAMDDFGTGYSSLNYLQCFPFDKIKIDRSFVKDITDGVGSLNIVRAVTAMAQGLGMTTTAEGVETNEQLEIVRAEGCTEMQGFLFSRPLPSDEVDRLLAAPDRARQASDQNAA